jgi:hypothetical protein
MVTLAKLKLVPAASNKSPTNVGMTIYGRVATDMKISL